jgi:phasin family protein
MTVKENLNLFNEMSVAGFERLNLLGELNLKVWERIANRQLDAVNLLVDQGARQARLATEARGYNEFVKGQVDLARETGERLMEESKNNLQIAGQVRDDYRAWFQDGVSELTAGVRKSTTAA